MVLFGAGKFYESEIVFRLESTIDRFSSILLPVGCLDLKLGCAPRDVGIGEDEVGITLFSNQDTRAAIIGGGDADGDVFGDVIYGGAGLLLGFVELLEFWIDVLGNLVGRFAV